MNSDPNKIDILASEEDIAVWPNHWSQKFGSQTRVDEELARGAWAFVV